MISNSLKCHLEEKYGAFTPVPLTGGYTNEVLLLKGSNPPIVIKIGKIFNKDIFNEVKCLELTRETDLTPRLYELMETDETTFTVMEYRQGDNAQSIFDQSNVTISENIYIELGKTLAKHIHSFKYDFNSYGIKESHANDINLNLAFVPEGLINKSKELLKNKNDSKDEWVLTHGDYGIHNVLYNSDRVHTVLDWEWSEWGNPLSDLAWVCWFTKLHYPEHANVLNNHFINEYLKFNPIHLPSNTLKSYCVNKVWKVLNRIHHAPLVVQQEWCKRLAWTLDTDIFDFMDGIK
ncbi:aminoglycoside phosphotransferase family protein [Bacillus sp. SM2101]|uniref:phosphotransferase family protein n=1 Tax=Bacillus sp. SM2101 TaxID=2805366 RepID=UPI001BDE6D8E|nr:aminoglycoside phosphotransferase family protein [Bacillus sp. SM2101]